MIIAAKCPLKHHLIALLGPTGPWFILSVGDLELNWNVSSVMSCENSDIKRKDHVRSACMHGVRQSGPTCQTFVGGGHFGIPS